MTLALIVIVASVLALIAILFLAKGRLSAGGNLDELAAQLRPIDVDAFCNLIDEREEQFLRERLPAREFRSIHRKRMLAAVEYVWGAAQNAGILIRLAEAAKHDSDPEVVAAAENLLENAFQLRLYSFQVVPRLYASMLMPSLGHAPYSIAEKYEAASRQMVTLRCLQSPGS